MFWSQTSHSTDRELLGRLAAPWKSKVQLDRLAAPGRKPHETFEFAVLGDCEPGRFWISRALFNRPGVFGEQLSRIQSHSIDFTIQLGDMVSCGVFPQYRRFLEELSGTGVRKPYLTVIGNHDRSRPHGRSHSRLYRSIFGPGNYRFDYGGVRFVVLDSSRGRVTCRQLKWLSMVLDTPLRKAVFTHMPPTLLKIWGGGPAVHHVGGFRQGAVEFAELMERRQVERVYMGHVHCFGVQDYRDVRYVLTGGGGSPLFPSGASDKFHHYLTVSAGPNGLRERVHSIDGTSFSIPPGKVLLDA